MKSIIIAALLGNASALKYYEDYPNVFYLNPTRKVWDLHTELWHRDDAATQKAYGDHSVKSANARTAENPYRSYVQLEADTVPIGQLIAMNDEVYFDEQNLQIAGDGFYNAWESGRESAAPKDAYERVVPDRYATGNDDLFQRSMITTYALEEKACAEDEDGKKTDECKPTGNFFLNETGARAAAKEVLATHKGITGDALKTYLDTYFAKAWSHFDVNKTGTIEVSKAPQFMRFLASDQRMSLGESAF